MVYQMVFNEYLWYIVCIYLYIQIIQYLCIITSKLNKLNKLNKLDNYNDEIKISNKRRKKIEIYKSYF
jgi:hypothetical protein